MKTNTNNERDTAQRNATYGNLRFFVVEDDPFFSKVLTFHLKRIFNGEIFCFSTGEEMLENLSLNPDIVILDYYLNSEIPSASSGKEIIEILHLKNHDIPVILLTANKEANDAVEIIKSGAADYIVKDKDFRKKLEIAINYIIYQAQTKTTSRFFRRKAKVLNYVYGFVAAAMIIIAIIIAIV